MEFRPITVTIKGVETARFGRHERYKGSLRLLEGEFDVQYDQIDDLRGRGLEVRLKKNIGRLLK